MGLKHHFSAKSNIELSCPAESPTAEPSDRSDAGPNRAITHFRGQLQRFVSFPTFDGGVDSYSALSEPKAA